jgi:hypothetical protein
MKRKFAQREVMEIIKKKAAFSSLHAKRSILGLHHVKPLMGAGLS